MWTRFRQGDDFVVSIEKAVRACDVFIALIGPDWLDIKDHQGNRRLDNPNDFVRIELATALKRGIRVIPVLLQDNLMPRAEELPADLAPLTRRNALEISHESFNQGVVCLIAAVQLGGKPAEDNKSKAESQRSLVSQKIPRYLAGGAGLIAIIMLVLWIAFRQANGGSVEKIILTTPAGVSQQTDDPTPSPNKNADAYINEYTHRERNPVRRTFGEKDF